MIKNYFFVFFLSVIAAGAQTGIPVLSPIMGANLVCSEPTNAATYSVTATNGPSAYFWQVNPSAGVTIANPGSNVTTISFANPFITYTVECVAMNSFGTSVPEELWVDVDETPVVSFTGGGLFCQGSSTKLTASPTMISASSTMSYAWTPTTGMSSANSLTVNVMPSASTIYTLDLMMGNCSNRVTYTVNITSCTGLTMEHAVETSAFHIYPNPSQGFLNITSDKPENITIRDSQGRVVRMIYVFSDAAAVIRDLAPGLYFATGGNITQKFIVTGE